MTHWAHSNGYHTHQLAVALYTFYALYVHT